MELNSEEEAEFWANERKQNRKKTFIEMVILSVGIQQQTNTNHNSKKVNLK